MASPITIHFFRHGDKQGDALTPKGRDQALQAGRDLRKEIQKNAIVKIYASPTVRTKQTGQYIMESLERRDIRAPRERKELAISGGGPVHERLVKEMGVDKYVEAWLKKALPADDSETAWETGRKLERKAVEFAGKLNTRFAKLPFYKRLLGRKPIHLIYVTHQGNMEALAQKLTGKGLDELGGMAGHLEHLQIKVPARGPLSVEYKGRAHEVRRR